MRSRVIRPAGAPAAHLPAALLVPAVAVSAVALIPLAYIVVLGLQTGLATFIELTFRPRVFELLREHGRAARSGRTCLRASGSWPRGSSSAPTCPGGARSRSCSRRPSSSRPSSSATAGSASCRRSHGLAGGVLIATLAYYPLVYLPVVATLRRLDPAARGGRREPRSRPAPCRHRRGPAAAAAADPRRGAARRAAPARRVRCLRDAPLRHVHDRDPPAVPLDVQRTGGRIARLRPRAVLLPAAPGGERGARRGPVRAHRFGRCPGLAGRCASVRPVCRWRCSSRPF